MSFEFAVNIKSCHWNAQNDLNERKPLTNLRSCFSLRFLSLDSIQQGGRYDRDRGRYDHYDRRGPPGGYDRGPPDGYDRRRHDDRDYGSRGGSRGRPPPNRDPYNDSYGPPGRGGDYGPPRRGPPQNRGGGRRDRNRRDEGVPGISLLVRNIGPQITNHDLGVAFGRIGDVRDVYIPRDYHSQQAKGFAFIEYADPERKCDDFVLLCYLRIGITFVSMISLSPSCSFYAEAREARDEMDRFRIKGCELEVVFAQERRKSPNEMRGRVVNQQNHGAGGGRNNRERSSSFERHQRRRRDNRDKDDNNNKKGDTGHGNRDDKSSQERSPNGKGGEE